MSNAIEMEINTQSEVEVSSDEEVVENEQIEIDPLAILSEVEETVVEETVVEDSELTIDESIAIVLNNLQTESVSTEEIENFNLPFSISNQTWPQFFDDEDRSSLGKIFDIENYNGNQILIGFRLQEIVNRLPSTVLNLTNDGNLISSICPINNDISVRYLINKHGKTSDVISITSLFDTNNDTYALMNFKSFNSKFDIYAVLKNANVYVYGKKKETTPIPNFVIDFDVQPLHVKFEPSNLAILTDVEELLIKSRISKKSILKDKHFDTVYNSLSELLFETGDLNYIHKLLKTMNELQFHHLIYSNNES